MNQNLFGAASVAAAVVFTSGGFSHAGLLTGNLDSDAQFNALDLPEVAVAEGRIGNNALNGTHELTIGQDTGAPAQTAQLVWGNGIGEAFSLSYDPGAGSLVFELGGRVLNYGLTDTVNGIYIRTRATNPGTAVTVDNLAINGDALLGSSSANGSIDGTDYFFITGSQLLNGFLLTGDATLAWENLPSQSQLAFQIKLTVPTPGTLGLAALVGLGAFRRRR